MAWSFPLLMAIMPIPLAILTCTINTIGSGQKVEIRAIVGMRFWIYVTITAVGFVATGLAVRTILVALDEPLFGPIEFWQLFFGVFAFEAVVRNLGLRVFNEEGLDLGRYIDSIRDECVRDALRRQEGLEKEEATKLALKLAKLGVERLRQHARAFISPEDLQQLEDDALQRDDDLSMLLAYALVDLDINSARAIVSAK